MTVSRSLLSACRRGSFELFLVWSAIIFVKRDLYFKPGWLDLDWQQMAACTIALACGLLCAGEPAHGYTSPFRRKVLRFALPAGLFFYTACACLCLKLNILACGPNLRCAGLAVSALCLIFMIWAGRHTAGRAPAAAGQDDEGCLPGPAGNAAASVRAAESDPKDEEEEEEEEPGQNKSCSGKEDCPTAKQAESRDVYSAGDSEPDLFSQSGPWSFLRYPYRTAILLGLAGQAVLLGSLLPVFALPGLFVAYKWEIQDIESYRRSQFGSRYLEYSKRSWALVPFIY